jgi:hypothetical protein
MNPRFRGGKRIYWPSERQSAFEVQCNTELLCHAISSVIQQGCYTVKWRGWQERGGWSVCTLDGYIPYRCRSDCTQKAVAVTSQSTKYEPTLFTETRLRPLRPQMPTGRRQTQLQRITALASHSPTQSNTSDRQLLPLKPGLHLNNT